MSHYPPFNLPKAHREAMGRSFFIPLERTMKKIALVLAFLLVLPVVAIAQDYYDPEKITVEKPFCPTSLISDNDKCMNCHVLSGGKFTVKESRLDAHLDYPVGGMKILNFGTDLEKGFYVIENIIPDSIEEILDYFQWHGIEHVIFEIYSPGGGVFASWRIKALFDEWIANGGIIETRVRAAAFSGGFMLAAAGSKGYRFANATAEFMWHEIQAVEGGWLRVETTSQKEHEAKVFRHLQDTINAWLATRGKLSKKELDSKVKYEEFWFTGKEAFELGFVDKLMGG
jgi:ATP-dependent protease ClpP protease subunit